MSEICHIPSGVESQAAQLTRCFLPPEPFSPCSVPNGGMTPRPDRIRLLPCLALPCLALPCLALPGPAWFLGKQLLASSPPDCHLLLSPYFGTVEKVDDEPL